MRRFLFLPVLLLIVLSCKRVERPVKPRAEKFRYKKEKLKEPEIKVLLKEGKGPFYISATSKYSLISGEKKYLLKSGDFLKAEFISYEKIIISFQGKKFLFNLPLIFETKGGYILFNNRRYRGKILFDRGERVINIVKIEDYLLSVVPPEIGGVRPSLVEAAKAQAVCARSYALRKYLERKDAPFHLYSDIKDQVYLGRDFENPWASVGVEATRGEVLMYRNEIALTLYHSTCGGRTADFNEAFPAMPYIPYLKSIKCNVRGKDLCSVSPYYRWERRYEKKGFINILRRNISKIMGVNLNHGDIKSFRISKRSRHGRVMEIQVKLGKGNQVFRGNEVRHILSDQRGPLPSTWFNLTQRGNEIIIKGKGFGHGVGLCQHGARELSKMGWSYEKILRFYYPGTRVKKIYN